MRIEISYIDDSEEWELGDLTCPNTAESICKNEGNYIFNEDRNYYLVLDDDDQVYAMISVPKDVPEDEALSEDGTDFIAIDYAMGEWGCTYSVYWNYSECKWSHL